MVNLADRSQVWPVCCVTGCAGKNRNTANLNLHYGMTRNKCKKNCSESAAGFMHKYIVAHVHKHKQTFAHIPQCLALSITEIMEA